MCTEFCVKAADTEAGRGQLGSAQLRAEAFLTLRILVAKVTLHAFTNFIKSIVCFCPGFFNNSELSTLHWTHLVNLWT